MNPSNRSTGELRSLAEKAIAVVQAKQPQNPTSWYAEITVKNALYKITDSRDLDVADVDAPYIAAANPSAVLALLDERDRLRWALQQFATRYAGQIDNRGVCPEALFDEARASLAGGEQSQSKGATT